MIDIPNTDYYVREIVITFEHKRIWVSADIWQHNDIVNRPIHKLHLSDDGLADESMIDKIKEYVRNRLEVVKCVI